MTEETFSKSGQIHWKLANMRSELPTGDNLLPGWSYRYSPEQKEKLTKLLQDFVNDNILPEIAALQKEFDAL